MNNALTVRLAVLAALVAGLAFAAAGTASAGIFPVRQDYSTGYGPHSVAVGDLNGDGRLDLATANFYSWTVSVLLGNGDGSFQPEQEFPTGATPTSVAIGDLNNDGKPDLAVTNTDSDTISVLLGNGDGSFQPKQDFATGAGPHSVGVADLNGDGRLDLAVTNRFSNTVSVLLGNGDGSFQPKQDFTVGLFPLSVAIGRLNSDARPDLAVANRDSNTVSVLLGNGDGTFQPKQDFATGSEPFSVALGDLDEDGHRDLAVADSGAATVSVLIGNGDGSFQPKQDFATGSRLTSVAVGDVNGDHHADLEVTNVDGASASILLGNGDGSFQPRQDFATGYSPFSVATADLNNDGYQDLAVANFDSATVSVLMQDHAPPIVSCGSPDGIWHATDVQISCTAHDAGGLANPADASFTLATSVSAGTETANAFTSSHQVCDQAGNCTTAGPIGGNKVDKKAPTINLTSPTNGAVYLLNQAVQAHYACLDPGSGVASCAAPLPSGANIATSNVGEKSFSVDSIDQVGNVSPTVTASYTVAYGVKLLFDPTRPTKTITLQLVDANGFNVSSASIVLTVQTIDGSPAPSATTFTVQKNPMSYKYMPKLSPGQHTLTLTATGDPTTHTVAFID